MIEKGLQGGGRESWEGGKSRSCNCIITGPTSSRAWGSSGSCELSRCKMHQGEAQMSFLKNGDDIMTLGISLAGSILQIPGGRNNACPNARPASETKSVRAAHVSPQSIRLNTHHGGLCRGVGGLRDGRPRAERYLISRLCHKAVKRGEPAWNVGGQEQQKTASEISDPAKHMSSFLPNTCDSSFAAVT